MGGLYKGFRHFPTKRHTILLEENPICYLHIGFSLKEEEDGVMVTRWTLTP